MYNNKGGKMKKIVLILSIFFINIYSICAIEINSSKAIMYNLDENKIIYEKNSEEKTSIASLTKIVTAITVIDNSSDLNKEVIITNNMLKGLDGYAKIGLKVGDKLSTIDLLYALMLPSAADAAQSLAIDISGSIVDFSDLMNQELEKIGVSNSRFDNPVGMDSDNNYSTAFDIAKILIYSLKNETFKTIFETDKYYINSINKTVNKTLSNYNIDTSIITGAKTGFTYDAGLCLASTSTINDINYLLVTLNSPINNNGHVMDAINLYDYFSSNYSNQVILKKGQVLKELKIKHGKKKYYEVKSLEEKKMYLENDFDISNIIIEYNGVEEITKKIKLHDKIGSINVKYKGDVIYTFDVYLEESLKYYNYFLYLSIILLIIIIFMIIKRKRKCK